MAMSPHSMHRKSRLSVLAAACAVALGAIVAPKAVAQPTSSEIADITWSLGPDLPDWRKGGAIGVVSDTIVYAGGSRDGTLYETSTVFGLVPGASSWTNLPSLPVPLAYTNGVTVNGEMYVVGGRQGGNAGTTQRTVRRLRHDGTNFVWDTPQQLMTLSRAYHTVGQIGSRIYAVAGGRFHNNSPSDWWDRQVGDVDSWDTANPGAGWSLIPRLPGVDRFSPTSAGVKDKLYVFGGTDMGAPGSGYDSDRLHDAYVYNPGTDAWSSLPNIPFGYSGGYASVYKDRYIILTGGVVEQSSGDRWPDDDPGFYNNMVIVFDTESQQYSIMPSRMPFATNDPRTVLIGDTLYAVGGEKGPPEWNTAYTRVGQIVLVPEPGAAGLLSIALLCASGLRPRRRAERGLCRWRNAPTGPAVSVAEQN